MKLEGLRQHVPLTSQFDHLLLRGLCSATLPRINEIDAAVSKVGNITGRKLRSSEPSNRGDLRIGVANWLAERAPMSSDLGKRASRFALETQDPTSQILVKHILGGTQESLPTLALRQQFNSQEDLCLCNRGRE